MRNRLALICVAIAYGAIWTLALRFLFGVSVRLSILLAVAASVIFVVATKRNVRRLESHIEAKRQEKARTAAKMRWRAWRSSDW